MTIARRDLVDNEISGFYHCTNRCAPKALAMLMGQALRRTFLCGIDELTGNDFSHRKDWIETRMIELCDIFAVNLFAYAVMSNHYHIVLYLEPLAPRS